MEITMKPVVSETLSAVQYFEEYRDLVVKFKAGGVYVYHDVEPDLYKRLVRYNHPWHRLHAEIKAKPYERVSRGIKDGPRVRVVKKNKKKEG